MSNALEQAVLHVSQAQAGPLHLGYLPDGLYLIQALDASGSVMSTQRIQLIRKRICSPRRHLPDR